MQPLAGHGTRLWIAGGLIAAGIPGCMPFYLLPIALNGRQCSDQAIARGSMVLPALLPIFAPMLATVAYWCLAKAVWPPRHATRRFTSNLLEIAVARRETSFVAVASAVLVISGTYWVSTAFSYFCIMPDRIILHPSAFGTSTNMSWDDVQDISIQCKSGRYGSFAGLNISVPSYRTLWVQLGRGEGADAVRYEAIRSTLEKNGFEFVPTEVPAADCPNGILRLLARPS